jgi:hypothetical protein
MLPFTGESLNANIYKLWHFAIMQAQIAHGEYAMCMQVSVRSAVNCAA